MGATCACFPWMRVKNLASRALVLAARQMSGDWLVHYGYAPVLLETSVDGSGYSGACYRAANWLALGKTVGRGWMDRHHRVDRLS
ncbi:MAG TPA: Druantia anti-phage system protein DruA [Bacillota bacterium]|nr:Druantia anti-phage system protein DruA [Bacillota bacterium]